MVGKRSFGSHQKKSRPYKSGQKKKFTGRPIKRAAFEVEENKYSTKIKKNTNKLFMEARGKLCRIRSDPNQRRALLFGSLTMIEGNEIFVCLFCFVFFRFRLMTDSGQNNEGDVGIRETQNQ